MTIEDLYAARWVSAGGCLAGATLYETWACRDFPRLTYSRVSHAGRVRSGRFFVDGRAAVTLADALAGLRAAGADGADGSKTAGVLAAIRARMLQGLASGLLATGLLLAVAAACAAGGIEPGLLGSIEIRVDTHPYTGKWAGVLRRLGRQRVTAPAWRKMIDTARHLNGRRRIEAVNAAVNHMIGYRADAAPADGEAADAWSTPAETLRAGGGDCEDYAIAKFAALRALGVPDAALRVAVVRTGRILHAVLSARLGGQTWILDNRADAVVAQQYLMRYVPLWSANAHGQWVHVVTPAIRARFVDRIMGETS